MGMAGAERDRRAVGPMPMGLVAAVIVSGGIMAFLARVIVAGMAMGGMPVPCVAMPGMVVGCVIMVAVAGPRMRMGVVWLAGRGMSGVIVPGMPPMRGPRRRGHRRGAGIFRRERRERGGG